MPTGRVTVLKDCLNGTNISKSPRNSWHLLKIDRGKPFAKFATLVPFIGGGRPGARQRSDIRCRRNPGDTLGDVVSFARAGRGDQDSPESNVNPSHATYRTIMHKIAVFSFASILLCSAWLFAIPVDSAKSSLLPLPLPERRTRGSRPSNVFVSPRADGRLWAAEPHAGQSRQLRL